MVKLPGNFSVFLSEYLKFLNPTLKSGSTILNLLFSFMEVKFDGCSEGLLMWLIAVMAKISILIVLFLIYIWSISFKVFEINYTQMTLL